jgi:hypothetical protein
MIVVEPYLEKLVSGPSAKLQRHKREAHRQTTPGSRLITRDTSLRNS